MTNTAPNADDSLLPAPMLIVEDDLLMQARLRDLLMVLGYTPEALLFAGSIAQAKALLADQPIAMALVDVGLPDGNGVDLIRVLHQRDATLPILVISTWNTEQVVVTALQAGATGYLLRSATTPRSRCRSAAHCAAVHRSIRLSPSAFLN